MKTTSLFVEIVIIGLGTFIGLSLLFVGAFDTSSIEAIKKEWILPSMLPATAFTYLLGIIIDRFSDAIFTNKEREIRSRHFQVDATYQRARMFIYTDGNHLKDLFEYSKSRLRICRGWVLNSAIISIGLNFLVAMRLPDGQRLYVAFVGNLFLMVVAACAYVTWYKLSDNAYKRLSEQYSFYKEK